MDGKEVMVGGGGGYSAGPFEMHAYMVWRIWYPGAGRRERMMMMMCVGCSSVVYI